MSIGQSAYITIHLNWSCFNFKEYKINSLPCKSIFGNLPDGGKSACYYTHKQQAMLLLKFYALANFRKLVF